ncbi:hypothetical protein DAI22_11g116766 [Oryza sativa Japonica Group]|nr:hypothetical protein DAI22_11g116766 [Oryza sativa Japonica Group]
MWHSFAATPARVVKASLQQWWQRKRRRTGDAVASPPFSFTPARARFSAPHALAVASPPSPARCAAGPPRMRPSSPPIASPPAPSRFRGRSHAPSAAGGPSAPWPHRLPQRCSRPSRSALRRRTLAPQVPHTPSSRLPASSPPWLVWRKGTIVGRTLKRKPFDPESHLFIFSFLKQYVAACFILAFFPVLFMYDDTHNS